VETASEQPWFSSDALRWYICLYRCLWFSILLPEELTDSNIGDISEHNRVVYGKENVINEELRFF